MIEPTISLGKFAAIASWVIVCVMMMTAWVVGLWVDWHVGALLALSSCAMSAVAAVLHIRCYSVRLASLVRAMSLRLGDDERVPLQRVH